MSSSVNSTKAGDVQISFVDSITWEPSEVFLHEGALCKKNVICKLKKLTNKCLVQVSGHGVFDFGMVRFSVVKDNFHTIQWGRAFNLQCGSS